MGAGSICSNVKSDKKLVVVKDGDEKIETGLKKFGAMLGDNVEVGCGSVLNPGTVIGRCCNIYPLSSVRGCVPANHIYKSKTEIAERKVENIEEAGCMKDIISVIQPALLYFYVCLR